MSIANSIERNSIPVLDFLLKIFVNNRIQNNLNTCSSLTMFQVEQNKT